MHEIALAGYFGQRDYSVVAGLGGLGRFGSTGGFTDTIKNAALDYAPLVGGIAGAAAGLALAEHLGLHGLVEKAVLASGGYVAAAFLVGKLEDMIFG